MRSIMFNNYILTALRNLHRHRLFSAINIVGLAIGLASVILIILFIRDEVGHDQWIADSDRIVRVHMSYVPRDGQPFETVRSAGRISEAISNDAPEYVEDAVRLIIGRSNLIRNGQSFSELVFYGDNSFFNVFDFPFLHGDKKTAMADVDNVVISEKIARKYFGRTDVIGETLTFCCLDDKEATVKISAVLKDTPKNTHFNVDIMLVIEPNRFAFAPNMLDTWTSVNVYTYFKLKDASDIAPFQAKIYDWLNERSMFKERMTEGKVTDAFKYKVMSIEDIHLKAIAHSGNMGGIKALGDIKLIYSYSSIALLVLVIACINFMNLSTARSNTRAREVALRKVVGASRSQLATQFISESIFICLTSFVLALAFVELALPFYNDMLGKQLGLDYGNMGFLSMLVGLSVFVGLIGGAYPAFILSNFRPALILKANQSSQQGGSNRIRAYLVVFQFAASICLVICTAIVYSQTNFARNIDLGYNVTGKMILRNIGAGGGNMDSQALKNRLLSLPAVTNVTYSSEVPSDDNNNNTGFKRLSAGGVDGAMNEQSILNYHSVDFDFMETYNIKTLKGRAFSEEFPSDTANPPENEDEIGTGAIMLNESATKKMGFGSPEEAIGQMVRASIFRAGDADMTIIGVIPDIYFRSIKFGIRPSVYFRRTDRFRNATIKFTTNDTAALIEQVEQVWNEVAPMVPYRYEFVNELIDAQYASEEARFNLFIVFSILAVIVACLGLYGLASFTAEQRTKEIGIRKVLGASVSDIIKLLIWQFSKPVLFSNIIAWPAAYFLMKDYLNTFQYRIDLSLAYFILASILALIIAWITVTWHAAKVARAKPINALRYE